MKNLQTYEEFVNEDLVNEVKIFGKDLKDFNKYKSELKSKIGKFIKNLKNENKETKEAFYKIIDSVKNKRKLSEEEKKEVGNQMKDALKLSGFLAASILPGGFIYLLLAKTPALKNYMIPSSFK